MNIQKIIIMLCLATVSLTSNAQYFTQYEAPNPVLFMPGPPSLQDSRQSYDFRQYFKGKDLRTNPNVKASITARAYYGADVVASMVSDIMGVNISGTTTINTWRLLSNGFLTSGYGTTKKNYYLRTRPCVRFNEEPGSYVVNVETLSILKRSYSYPSSHTITAWNSSLLMAAIAPQFQDTLVNFGYDYGQSRVIGGAHWQSDVDDARTIGTACIGHMMATDLFKSHLQLSRNELAKMLADSLGIEAPDFNAENYYDAEHMPNPLKYLPAPPSLDESNVGLAYDMDQYVWGKSLRTSDRGIKAKFDVNKDFDILVNECARAVSHDISQERSPAVYNLLKLAVEASEAGCAKAQEYYKRKHPFEFFNEDALTFENQSEIAKTGSYPSVGAARAWTAATIMCALDPEKQDTILNAGYQLAMSNVIAGINWRSDVEAGFLVTGATIARLLSNPNFMTALEAAQQEYAQGHKQLTTDEIDVPVDKTMDEDTPMYTIDGRLATEQDRGVLVSKNRKILKR